MAMARSADFRTPTCRLLFSQQLFEPRAAQEGGKKKYGCTLLFDNTVDRSALDSALKEVILAEWGEKGIERAKKGVIKSPFLAGDGPSAKSKQTGEFHTGMGPGKFFIRPSATLDFPPQIYANSRQPLEPGTPQSVYSGCYGYAVLNAFAWNNPQNGDGVSFGIKLFFKTSDGESLGGGAVQADSWAESVEDTGAAPAETRGGAGAGGLFG